MSKYDILPWEHQIEEDDASSEWPGLDCYAIGYINALNGKPLKQCCYREGDGYSDGGRALQALKKGFWTERKPVRYKYRTMACRRCYGKLRKGRLLGEPVLDNLGCYRQLIECTKCGFRMKLAVNQKGE